MKAILLQKFIGAIAYPPGSIFISTHMYTVDDLATLYGGTWSKEDDIKTGYNTYKRLTLF